MNILYAKHKIIAGASILSTGFFLSIFLLLIAGSISVGQTPVKIHSIEFSGNRVFSNNQLINSVVTERNAVFSEIIFHTDMEHILEFYKSQGYLHARIDSVWTYQDTVRNEIDIHFFLNEGKPAIVHNMEFDGNKNLASHELFSVMETREGDHFIPNMLERDMGAILQKYEQAGYPLAKAIVKNVFFSDSVEEMATSIKIMIEEGPAVHISELRVEGNKTTKDYVITREARIRENELFCGDLPERIKRRIDRLQLFTSVSLPELYLTDVGAGLFVQVVEGNQNYFDGVLGYLPSNRSDESGYLTGLVDIQLRNLLGTGRKLAARWYQENRNTQEIELHYFEPWIASYPVNAQLGFFQRKQDSTFVRMQYDIAADLMVTEEFSVGTSFSQTNVFPSERYGRSVMAESNTKSFGASVRYDSRDNPVTPTSGVFYSTQYHTGTKQTHKTNIFTSDSKFNTQRVEFDLSYFFSPILQQVIAAELHIRSFSSSNIDASDLFHFGGATTLRGYREGQFLGSRIVWSNLEYRFLVALRSFFYGFIDLGYIIQPENVIIGLKESEQSKIGYGIGVRMDSILGLIGVSFAFGEGDTFSTSKIHIRLINEF